MVAHPIVGEMADYKEVFWINPKSGMEAEIPFGMADIEDAEARLARFAPYIAKAFPETEATKGIIESKLVEIPKMKTGAEKGRIHEMQGRVWCSRELYMS